ncbi:MAG TPA: IS66 family transposase [Candidatus Dormibacteraeota bacterium]|nr:IS66 family transposase [Candidatus Dormibacteraeota bacterium]
MATRDRVTSAFAPDLEELRAWLQTMLAALRFADIIVAVIGLIGRMRDINTQLVSQLAHLRRRHPRSETLGRLERQLVLPLAGIVPPALPQSNNPSGAEPKKSRKGRHPGRAMPPAHLPRIPVFNRVPPELRVCPQCGATMTTVGHASCLVLNVIPARVVVEERLDETVACPNDDTIVSASPPPQIVERGKLADALIVEAVCDKYLDHLPIERQCTRFARAGVEVAPQTLGRSVGAAIDLLAPVARLIEEQTRAPGLLGTDATGLPVLDPTVTDGIRNGTMWCWTNARWVTFFYSAKGDSDSVRRFLGDDLARTVQCDGTSITTFLERAGGQRPGCWAHARRRLVEAARAGDRVALEGVRILARIFTVERESTCAGDTAEQRRERRERCTKPILNELRSWMDQQRAVTPPKTPLGQGLGYLDRQWRRLLLFMGDGNIEATNNRRERELRRLILGRKNWLFTWLDEGGDRTGDILSIVATCIAHDVNPRAYLHRVVTSIVHGWPHAKLRELLPDRMLLAHPDLYIGDPDALPMPTAPRSLAR